MGRSTVNPFTVQINFVPKNTKWTLFSVTTNSTIRMYSLEENELSSVITQTAPLECTHQELSLEWSHHWVIFLADHWGFGRFQLLVNFAFWQQKGPRTILFSKSDYKENTFHNFYNLATIYLLLFYNNPLWLQSQYMYIFISFAEQTINHLVLCRAQIYAWRQWIVTKTNR